MLSFFPIYQDKIYSLEIKTKRPHLYQFHFIMQQFCDVEQYFWRERKNANTELNEASRSGSSCEEFDTFIEWF